MAKAPWMTDPANGFADGQGLRWRLALLRLSWSCWRCHAEIRAGSWAYVRLTGAKGRPLCHECRMEIEAKER